MQVIQFFQSQDIVIDPINLAACHAFPRNHRSLYHHPIREQKEQSGAPEAVEETQGDRRLHEGAFHSKERQDCKTGQAPEETKEDEINLDQELQSADKID